MANIDAMENVLHALLKPSKLWSRAEVLIRPCPVPKEPGIYGWYFKEIPPQVPVDGCNVWKDLTLLYLGISPSRKTSKRDLAKRIRYHFKGNAYGSTLRKTLGCIMRNKLGIRLQRIGNSEKRMHFAEGEAILSEWMEENAYVTWVIYNEPWIIEGELINRLNLPLNLMGNEEHPFHQELSKIRQQCRKQAKY